MGGLERDSDKIQLILLWKGVFPGNFISAVHRFAQYYAHSKRCNCKCSASNNLLLKGTKSCFLWRHYCFIVGSWSISPKPLLQSNRGSYNKQSVKVWKRFSVFSTRNKLCCKCFRLRLRNALFSWRHLFSKLTLIDFSETFATI